MKENHNKFWRLLTSVLCLMVWCAMVSVHAQEDREVVYDEDKEQDEAENEPWEVRKANIEAFMKSKILEYASKENGDFTEGKAIEKLKMLIKQRIKDPTLGGDFSILRASGMKEIDWVNYGEDPTRELEEIIKDVHDEAERNALEFIKPEEREKEIRRNAETKYHLYKINDRVPILVIRNGRGAGSTIENKRLRGVTDLQIQLGNRFIIRDDISPEDQAMFYPEVNERLKQDYITNRVGQVWAEVDNMIRQECLENTPMEFLAANYVPDISKPNASLRTAKPEYWIPKKQFVAAFRKKIIEQRVILYINRTLPTVMRTQYPEDKYGPLFYVQTEDGTAMEWIDETEKKDRENKAKLTAQGPDGENPNPNMAEPPGPTGPTEPGVAPPPARRR